MDVHTNIPLKNYTTIKLGGPARFMSDVHSKDELASLYKNARERALPVFVLGGGSNVVVHDEGFAGLILRVRINGFEVINDDVNNTTIKIGAGESWDETVKRTVDMKLTGIEAMSAIPGTVGAAPVQNVGAYGQEIADTLVSIEAYDTTSGDFVELTNEQCGFSYRHSIFRGEQKGRYIICSVTLRLSKSLPAPPFYEAVQNYFDSHAITIYTHQALRDAVIAIRRDKLPDPNERPNAGSFFKNAIIEQWQLASLLATYPDAPHYEMGDGKHKVPTGWLIEQTGLKGQLLHGMRVHDKNCLVLINESAQSYKDLAAAREAIVAAVRDKFQIIIEQEPLEL